MGSSNLYSVQRKEGRDRGVSTSLSMLSPLVPHRVQVNS